VTTRQLILAALREAGGLGVNGEELAAEIGVSRVAVSKHVAALRALGYKIDASPNAGYRLTSVPDLSLPTEVEPLLHDDMWVTVEGGIETTSTNDDARALARSGAPEGTVVVAARQREGRGRLGRTWASPEGGAYVSAILRPPIAPAQAGPLALVVSIGIARGLMGLGLDPRLKWPNDVWLGGHKLAGVLLEMMAEGDRVDWVVIGFGLNVRRGDNTDTTAAFIGDTVPGLRVANVAAAALDGVASAYRQWLEDGFAGLAVEFEARSVLTGQDVTVRDGTGTVKAQGTVGGIDAEGRLLLEADGRTEAVVAGEVTLRA